MEKYVKTRQGRRSKDGLPIKADPVVGNQRPGISSKRIYLGSSYMCNIGFRSIMFVLCVLRQRVDGEPLLGYSLLTEPQPTELINVGTVRTLSGIMSTPDFFLSCADISRYTRLHFSRQPLCVLADIYRVRRYSETIDLLLLMLCRAYLIAFEDTLYKPRQVVHCVR